MTGKISRGRVVIAPRAHARVVVARQGRRGRREAHDVIVASSRAVERAAPGDHLATPRTSFRGTLSRFGTSRAFSPSETFPSPPTLTTRPRTAARDARRPTVPGAPSREVPRADRVRAGANDASLNPGGALARRFRS